MSGKGFRHLRFSPPAVFPSCGFPLLRFSPPVFPLFDHFHPPLSERRHCKALHARWASAVAAPRNSSSASCQTCYQSRTEDMIELLLNDLVLHPTPRSRMSDSTPEPVRTNCLPARMLEAFALGILSVEEQTAAAGHLEQCPRCTEALRGKQSCEAVSTTGFQSACLRPLAGNSEMSAVATRRWEPWSASGMPDALDEQARRSFESAWSEGAPQSIEQFLPAADDPRYLATLEELVHIEIEFQWKAWSTAEGTDTRIAPARVEDYLQRFPALRRADCTRRLAAQEFRIRKRHGTRPTPEE